MGGSLRRHLCPSAVPLIARHLVGTQAGKLAQCIVGQGGDAKRRGEFAGKLHALLALRAVALMNLGNDCRPQAGGLLMDCRR